MAAKEQMEFIDASTNQHYVIMMTQEDAARARTDSNYATQVLENFRINSELTQKPTPRPSGNTEAEVSNLQSTPSTSSENEIFFCWKDEATLLFLSFYEEAASDFNNGRKSKAKCWAALSNKMASSGYEATGAQCASKFQSLRKMYKSVKDHNGKSGNSRKDWPFLEVMDNLFGGKPEMSPLSTASSCGTTEGVEVVHTPGSSGRKHPYKQALHEMFKKKEEEKERRHKEKIAQRDNMFTYFKNYLEKK